MVPSARLIWLVVLVGFPAAVAAGVAPELLLPMIAIIASSHRCCRRSTPLMRKRALAGLRVETPDLARFFKDREAEIRVRIHNPSKQARRVRIGIPSPAGLEATDEERLVDLPARRRARRVRLDLDSASPRQISLRHLLSGSGLAAGPVDRSPRRKDGARNSRVSESARS